MRIALLAPFDHPTPPKASGGTELRVANIAKGLVENGHEVFVLATGESTCSGTLIPIFPQAIQKDPYINEPHYRETIIMDGIARVLSALHKLKLDIVHNNGWRFIPFAENLSIPVVTTLNLPLDTLPQKRIYQKYSQHPYISSSYIQRRALPNLNYIANVHNGINIDEYPFSAKRGLYLTFLGRISKQKGPSIAIEIAKKFGMPLHLAGKVEQMDIQYFKTDIESTIDQQQTIFKGEINRQEKGKFLGQAYALIAPLQWEEPFGTFMIEAMACGTPVVALNRGSVSEVIIHGKTGFIANSPEEIVSYLHRIPEIDRLACRQHVEKYFTHQTMTKAYLAAYYKVLYEK